jgi:invasion protein IalB
MSSLVSCDAHSVIAAAAAAAAVMAAAAAAVAAAAHVSATTRKSHTGWQAQTTILRTRRSCDIYNKGK